MAVCTCVGVGVGVEVGVAVGVSVGVGVKVGVGVGVSVGAGADQAYPDPKQPVTATIATTAPESAARHALTTGVLPNCCAARRPPAESGTGGSLS